MPFAAIFDAHRVVSELGDHYCLQAAAPAVLPPEINGAQRNLVASLWDSPSIKDDLQRTLKERGGFHIADFPAGFAGWSLPEAAWLDYLLLRQRVAAALLPSAGLRAALSTLQDDSLLALLPPQNQSTEVLELSHALLPRGSAGIQVAARTRELGVPLLTHPQDEHRDLRGRYLGRPLEPIYPRHCVVLDGGEEEARKLQGRLDLVARPVRGAVTQAAQGALPQWRDAMLWAVIAFGECACVGATSALALVALEVRKVRGLPFLDTECQDCGPQRLSNQQLLLTLAPVLRATPLQICIWGFLSSGPWGGGAHFLLALSRAFKRMGHKVCNINNEKGDAELDSSRKVDLHILVHSLRQIPPHLAEKLLPLAGAASAGGPPPSRVIFRTDGPQTLARGTPAPHEDVALFSYVSKYATKATVFQSEWSLNATINLGHKPVNPVIIGNAPDPSFYNRLGRADPSLFWQNKRVRLCISVWSDGPRKNWPLIVHLDRHLDFTRYSLTLVGRLPPQYVLNNTRHIPPLKQRHLGALLRRMHVFIAPSYNECFSNAEAQAIGCGLPVLALRDSSHPEVVGRAGRFFTGPADVLQALEALVANYEHYAARALPNDIDDVALQFLQAARLT